VDHDDGCDRTTAVDVDRDIASWRGRTTSKAAPARARKIEVEAA
jgi:hypothetical protein